MGVPCQRMVEPCGRARRARSYDLTMIPQRNARAKTLGMFDTYVNDSALHLGAFGVMFAMFCPYAMAGEVVCFSTG